MRNLTILFFAFSLLNASANVTSIRNFLTALSAKSTFHGNQAYTELEPEEDIIVYKTYGHNSFQRQDKNVWLYHFGSSSDDGFVEEGHGYFIIQNGGLFLNSRPAQIIKSTDTQLHFRVCINGSNSFQESTETNCSGGNYSEFDFRFYGDVNTDLRKREIVVIKRNVQNNLIKNQHIFKGQ